MSIKIEVTPFIAEKILRDDIVKNLGYIGISAIIEWYDDIGEDIEFDQSLFWCWSRYDNAIAAVEDHDSSVVEEFNEELREDSEDGEDIDANELEEKCREWLNDNTCVIDLEDGILVNREY